jgi:hypothetical protein
MELAAGSRGQRRGLRRSSIGRIMRRSGVAPARRLPPGCAVGVFKAVGVALPPLVTQLPPATPPPPAVAEPSPRRGCPQRGATRP